MPLFAACRASYLLREAQTYDDGDFNDLNDLLNGINNLTGQAKRNFIFDNLDIPRVMNYLAAMVVLHDNDAIGKNYYLYRDTAGTKRWYILPWDKDLTLGRNYNEGGVLNDDIWANVDFDFTRRSRCLAQPSVIRKPDTPEI